MKNFDSRVYSVSDFLEWHGNGLLLLSPDFQRRSVWSEKAKSYLMDSIIRSKPIPKLLITQNLEGRRTVREVVDGQQRLRAILEFINGDFKISRAHNRELAGLTYDGLPADIQNEFLEYELGVDILFGLSYEETLDIFTRINSYTVNLNRQEKINAAYVGYFKQYVYDYGYRYVRYFLDGTILTKQTVSRMAEAELTADLFVALIGGVQTNKNVEQYYKRYEDDIGPLEDVTERFDTIMSYVGGIYSPEELARTNWRRSPLFYTLFTAIGHCLYGLENLNQELRVAIAEKSLGKLRVQLDEIDSRYNEIAADIRNDAYPDDYKYFIDISRRRTADTRSRIDRANFVCNKLRSALA